MLAIKPITKSMFWVQASPFASYFTTFSGIQDSSGTSQYPDGVRGKIFQLKGPRTVAEITMSTPFDPIKHTEIIDFWKSYGCEFLTLSVTPVTCGEDPEPLGQRTIVVPDAQMVSLNFGEVDRSSSDASMIEISFVLDTYTYN